MGVDELDAAGHLDIDAAAERIDRAVTSLARGIITVGEAIGSIEHTAALFMRFSVAPADDVEIIIDYSRAAVEEIATSSQVMDPVWVEHFEEWLRGQSMVDEIQMRLDTLLSPMLAAARIGDQHAMEEIARLCRSGHRLHRRLFSLSTAAEQVLRSAYDVGCADALRDAVSPRHRYDGQIAGCDADPHMYVLALNLLAQLAADPARGERARSALLDLAEHLEVTSEAITRLPMHLLGQDDRSRLLDIHERRTRLLCDDPLFIPLSMDQLRANRVVRAALWLSFDARHIV